MKTNRSIHIPSLILISGLLLIMGCNGAENPSAPDPGELFIGNQASAVTGRSLWGFWEIEIDPETQDVSIVPVRSAMFNANVLQFMQPPMSPTHMLSIYIDMAGSDIPNNLLAIDVSLQHPFPGVNMYCGFDVRGIFMSDASQSAGFDSSAEYANWFDAGPGIPTTESVLLNSDGYTRWWNPSEFTSYGTIFGYTQGGLATPGYSAGATLNPFKYFTDGLGAEDPFEIDPTNRGSFGTVPGINTRRYLIQFDATPFRYNYAVDASWSSPDPGQAPDYPIEAFNISANCQEAYKISLVDAGSDTWYEDSVSNGGSFILDIEVYDWQAFGYSTVIDEISAIWIESPAFDGGGNHFVDILSGSYNILPGSNETSAIFQAEVGPFFGAGGIESTGTYPVLIAVESSNPDTYEPQIDGGGNAFDWPDAPLCAYNMGTVDVLGESLLTPTLVMEDTVVFTAELSTYHAFSPAVIVENDNDLAFAYAEWDTNPVPFYSSYAAVYRSHDDGTTWPDWRWNQHSTSGSWRIGDTIKIWPSSHDLSYQIYNLTDTDETTYSAGHASGTFPDGPNGSEKANNFNNSIDRASEILQDVDKYVYFLGDSGGQIRFKRSMTPECLNCAPGTFSWSGYPTYNLVNPGRLSRVRSSALYSGTMYLAYFEPGGDVIRLAYNVGDGFTWDTSIIVWDASSSGTHSPRDPGLLIDDTGFHVTFVRTDFLTGFKELCYTWSVDTTTWSEPVVIRSNVFELLDSPICRYDWGSYSVLATVWSENEKIWTSFSLDIGSTWASPILVSEMYDENQQCDLDIAPSENWHMVYSAYNPTSTYWEIHYRRAHLEMQ